MSTIIAFNMLPLLLAFVFGLTTGWWIWANRDAEPTRPVGRERNADRTPTRTIAPSTPPIAPAPPLPAATPPVPSEAASPDAATPAADPAVAGEPSAATASAIGIADGVGAPDNLLLLKGVGPKLNNVLITLGITRFDQIAAWSPEDIAQVNEHLGTFRGRIERDAWIEQAQLLSSGDVAGFEARFGKLDGARA